jgi:hypothetical protein
MELDEMKTLWKETERRLEAMEPALRLNQRLAKTGTLDRMRSKLRSVRLVLWYEVAFGVLAALLLGSYLFDHLGTIRFALPAAALHLGAILTLGFAVRQLVALSQIDYAGPVVGIQRRLAELGLGASRSLRARRLPRVRSALGRQQLRLRARGPRRGGVGELALPGRLPELGVPAPARRGPDRPQSRRGIRVPGRHRGLRDGGVRLGV